MPDEEPNPSSDAADAPDSGGDGAPSYAAGHDDDAQNPRPGSDDSPVTPQEIEQQNKDLNDAYTRLHEDESRRNDDHNQLALELQRLREEAAKEPPAPPEPSAMPAPPNQEQKNNIATLGFGLLKWAALLGISYGLSRKSPHRNTVFKLGLAAAINGYYAGSNPSRDKALSLWEKNRQAILDNNRQEQQRYKDTMENHKFTLQQKMDIFKEQAQMNRDAITWDAARRGDINAIQSAIKYRDKLNKDFHTQMKKQQQEWYKAMGLPAREGALYREWIMGKGGPDIRKAKDQDEEMDIESKYPIHQMLEEDSKKKREEGETEKKEAEDRAFELHKREKTYDTQLQQGGPPDDPNAPISDQKAQEMRDKIFGSGSD
jgi:hypothetical protein